MTVLEVCAVILTVIAGIMGFEFVLAIRSVRKLAEEAQHTLAEFHSRLPRFLEDAEAVAKTIRTTSERVGVTVNQAAGRAETIKKEALSSLSGALELAKEGLGLWQTIRRNKKNERAVG